MRKSIASDPASAENAEITLGVLNAVHNNEVITQRSVADELGVALGLVNAYLKRCVLKGYVKIRQAPRNRYAYYLTPQGFAEKSRLTAEYLAQGFKFFGLARREIVDLYRECDDAGWQKIALYGLTDLTDIAMLCANDSGVRIAAIIEMEGNRAHYAGVPVIHSPSELDRIDAIVITDTRDPQKAYDELIGIFPAARVLTPGLLNISRSKPQ